MNFGSLFSGIGGMDLGLEWAGMICAWQNDIDDYCLRVLNKIWPDVPKYRDVRDVGRHNLEPVDLIAGGFPCQPHSVAGKRRGAEDDRNLWPEFSRIIAELRPRYVLAENVPGIITTYLDTVLSDLESQGYTCGTFNIPACAFDAPHRRERIFVVAHTTSKRCRETRTNRTRPEKRTSRSSATSGNVAFSKCGASGGGAIARESNGQERQLPKAGRESLQPRNGQTYPSIAKQGSEDVADAISDSERRAYGKDSRGSQQGKEKQNISKGSEIRGFIADCSRQWTVEPDVGRVAHGVPSRVDRLRTLGNAVVPQVAEWIGKRILEYAQNDS